MKNIFLTSMLVIALLTACSDDSDKMDCQRAVQEQLEIDLKKEDDAVKNRLATQTLTSEQKIQIIGASSERKKTMRESAARRSASCD